MVFKLVFAQVYEPISQKAQCITGPMVVLAAGFIARMAAPIKIVEIVQLVRAVFAGAEVIQFKIPLSADMIFMEIAVGTALLEVRTDVFAEAGMLFPFHYGNG